MPNIAKPPSQPEAGGYARMAPALRQDMGKDIARRQALTAEGAVDGAGGYVYKPMPDGSVTIMYDPSGAANGVNLRTGEAFQAIDAELKSKGVSLAVDPVAAEPMNLGTSDPDAPTSDLGAMSPDQQAGATLGAQSGQGLNPLPAPPAPVPDGADTASDESPRDLRNRMGSLVSDGSSGTGTGAGGAVTAEPGDTAPTLGKGPEPSPADTAFTPPIAENDRLTDDAGAEELASAALALPANDPRRLGAIEAALRQFVKA